MRKNIVVSALALIGAVAFTSCVRENLEPSGESQKGNGVNITVNTGSVDLKSYIEYDEAAGKYLPKWHKGDALGAYFVNASGANPASLANANEDGTKASFTGTASLTAGDYTLYAVYPARAVQSVSANLVAELEFPYIQFPSATSFDPKADILVNVPHSVSVEDAQTAVTVDNMCFRRAGSIVKVVLSDKTGTLAGDRIKSVYLESDMAGAALSGVLKYDYKTEDAAGMSSSKNHVTADLTRLETLPALDGQSAVYLVLPPCTLTAGSKLTVNVKTDKHEVVKNITLPEDIKCPSSEVVTLNVSLDASCTIERVYFQDNFDWLYYWWDSIPSSAKDGIRDPMAAGTANNQKQPNIWSTYSSTIGADVSARGYVDLNQTSEVLYIQENFFKLGKTEEHGGLELPSVAFGTSPVDVELSFKYAVQDVKVDLVVEVLNAGKCPDTDKTRSLTLFSEDALIWKTARVILSGVTDETRIQIKPDLRKLINDDDDVSEKYRWFLDDIKIIDAPERSESMFPVIWSFPTPGDSWVQGTDYDIVTNTGGSYIYSNDHAGKLSMFVPDNRENTSENKYIAGTDVTGSSQYVMTQYGIYEGSYWLFEIDDVTNPAGTYNITYYSHSSSSGPKYFLMEYSLDNGETWTSINPTTGTFYYNNSSSGDYGDPMEITYTYELLSKKKNRICESFHLDAINTQTKLMIRSKVAEDYRASKNGSIASNGSHRIGCNVVISFTPDAQ